MIRNIILGNTDMDYITTIKNIKYIYDSEDEFNN
jgi:hypothetical protein